MASASPPAATAPASDSSAPTRPPALPERYEDLGRLARGGWGEVRRVRDRVMDRVVAMKILAWKHLESPSVRARFMNEARVTAALAHPGVVPVHDQGVLEDGRPWFTMKEIDGPTLDALVEQTRANSSPPMSTLRRLLESLARVCETVGFAHGRGIVHRDLKPANVMLGAFGEVLVLDWGIARSTEPPEPDSELAPASVDDFETNAGDIVGTAAYMSPEQAQGTKEEVGPPSDVFALGLVLYYVLTGTRARTTAPGHVWGLALNGETPPLTDPRLPEELVRIYERAVRPLPSERYADASTMGAALRAYLDGEARREKADGWVQRATEMDEELRGLRRETSELRGRARQLRSALRAHDPVDQKRPMWALEDRAEALERRAALLETHRLEALRLALQEDPDHEQAHRALALAYRARLIEAEAEHRHGDASAFELLLRRHDRGEHARFLSGHGTVTLLTTPVGARVSARRYEVVDRRLVLGPAQDLGPTPLRDVELPMGSYILDVQKEGCAAMRYPVKVGRDESWDGTRPGEPGPMPIPLLPRDALDGGEVYVPAGWVALGGDSQAIEPVPRARRWIDGFVMQRFPVTIRAYLAFLDDLLTRGERAQAESWSPRLMRGMGAEAADLRAVVLRDGSFHFVADEWGRDPDPEWPIACVSWFAACAYARWLSERTGLPWRLPNELEWEKAARGVDERVFPWGAEPEPTWACIVGSTPDEPTREPVRAHPSDESPYGVRGLAGNVRDWCINVWRDEGPLERDRIVQTDPADPADPSPRAIRGGAWNAVPAFARLAGRFASPPEGFFGVLGFRLVRPVGQEDEPSGH